MSEGSLQSTPPTPEPQTVQAAQPAVPPEAAPPESPAPLAPDAPAPTAVPDVEALRQRAVSAERELTVAKVIHAVNWLKLEDAESDLKSRAVQDENGTWKIKALTESKLLTPADAVQELATLKPEWVKARVQPGTGARGSVEIVNTRQAAPLGNAQQPGLKPVTYSELLRPENKQALQEYIYHKKDELERMRSVHFGF